MTQHDNCGSRLLQPLVSVTKIGTQPPIGVERMRAVEQTDDSTDHRFPDAREEAPSSPPPPETQTPMEADKEAIYRYTIPFLHLRFPCTLFLPVCSLLFEKCEQSTQSSECITSASFDVDIENFVRSQEKEGKAFFSNDPDLDNLMVKAIQVLRIHLLELEKVSDLCKDFCSRYIACLKTKMNSETLLSGEPGSPYSPTPTQVLNPYSPTPTQVLNPYSPIPKQVLNPYSPAQIQTSTSSFTGTFSPQGIVVPASALQQGNVTVTTVNPSQMVTGGTVYQPVTVVTPQGQLQLQLNQDLSFFNHDDLAGSSKNKRGVLPKQATNVMRSWLFQHIGHPYPTEDEKKQIATQTNLTLLQVNNWFINARRRILQPMLDSSSSETPKAKKKTPQNRPLQRFWPDSIASGAPQQQVTMADGTMVTVGMSVDGLHTLSSDGATLAVQQVMMGGQSEDDSGDSGDEDEEGHLSNTNISGLGLDTSDSLQ
ncbi:hypothetical protein JZ751_012716 [Albula glossodonta]|uniref:Homeobox domain-containing protein n=1 Tax=Albula glossodonta TaxID=121402 RepID=A0A8T2MZS4_9TELE|nr:hypothetical protein JZ751_012716 [Albula glossodonta]